MTEMIRRNCVKIRSTVKVNKYSAFPFLEYGKKKKTIKKQQEQQRNKHKNRRKEKQ